MTANEFLFKHGSDIHTMGNNDEEVCYFVIQPKDLIAFAKLKVDETSNEANDLIAELTAKANKYDELVAKVAKFGEVDENGEDVMKGCDLCDIGEVVASELGFI